MNPLIYLHIKVVVVLGLVALVFPGQHTLSVFVCYSILAGASIFAFFSLAGKDGIEGAIHKLVVSFPKSFEEPIKYFDRYFPWILGGLLIALVGKVVYHRYFAIRVRRILDRYVKIRLDQKSNIGEETKIDFRLEDFIRRGPDSGPNYFIGMDNKKTPVWTTEKDLTRNVQVVGPPGTGKSVLLFNMAVQAVQKGKAVCFVDGKGDMSFLSMVQSYFTGSPEKKDFLYFTPLSPETSHTYNPLISIQDPGELTDMLTNGLNLNVVGPGKVYSDTQKAYLLLLFNLFLNTGRKFNFIDLMVFTNYFEIRERVYGLVGDRQLVDDMEHFLKRLKANQPELLGLTTQIQKLFCSDPLISSLVNPYSSDIVVKDVFEKKKFCVFSLSAGKKAETNEALAKMVISDVANAVGERMGRSAELNDFAELILDEFGQYVPASFDKFITTARGANIGCILSHQSNSQLIGRDGVDRLAGIVRECANTTILFKQAEEADFWSKILGTRTATKRTDVIEGSEFLTEKKGETGSLREVEEFLIHPNKLKQLGVGQVAYRAGDKLGQLVSIGMFNLAGVAPVIEKPQHVPGEEGLNLQLLLKSLRRVPLDKVPAGGGTQKSHDGTFVANGSVKKKKIVFG